MDAEQLQAQRQHEMDLEVARGVITFGQGAIKSLFFLNAGAVVALLALVGHVAQFNAAKVPEFANGVLLFALGVLVAAVVALSAYLSQSFYSFGDVSSHKKGELARWLCIFLACVSLGLFMCGLFVTHSILQAYA